MSIIATLITYNDNAEWILGIDRDYAYNYGTGLGYDSYTSFYKDYSYFIAQNSSDENTIHHGDWSLYALESELNNQSDVEIILIDIDEIDLQNQISKLFSLTPSIYSNSGYSTVIEYILKDWTYTRGTKDINTYIPTLLSISISGALPDFGTTLNLAYLADQDVTIIQAAPNVNQGIYDWGSVYKNVINVGAWNIDKTKEPLWSSIGTLSTLDILANGYIEKSGWGSGWNFGTSFATPRVSAEIINFYAYAINFIEEQIDSGIITKEDIANNPKMPYSDIVDFLIKSTTKEVYYEINSTWSSTPIKVLAKDVTDSPYPQTVPITIPAGIGMSGYLLTNSSLTAPLLNSPPTLSSFGTSVKSTNEDTSVSISFSELITAGNEADDGSISSFVVKAISSGSLTLNGTAWNPTSNNTIDSTKFAVWTPAANANGTLNAFTAVAKDNTGLESATAVQAKVAVTAVNDAPTLTSFGTSVKSTNEDTDVAPVLWSC